GDHVLIERVCVENELVINTWSPVHLRDALKAFYWTNGRITANALAFWEDSLKYLYLPRLRKRDVLVHAIRIGAGSRDFFGTAYGQSGETFEGFDLGNANVQVDDTLLLIEPEAARAYADAHRLGPTTPGPVSVSPTAPLGPPPPRAVPPQPGAK